MDKLKKINIQSIKKILQIRGYKVSKKNESLVNIYYTVFASIFLVFVFYTIPLIKSFSSKVLIKNKIVINTSNKNFNRVLEGKQIELSKNNENDNVNYEELFIDIFNFDIEKNDTVRLSASTINQLFNNCSLLYFIS